MTSNVTLVALQFAFYDDTYEANYEKLVTLITQAPDGAIITAPELCLTNFSYDHMQEAAAFSTKALHDLCIYCKHKTVILTVIEKVNNGFINSAKIIHNGTVIYTQSKAKLFTFGGEDKHFQPGNEEKIQIVEIDGLKFAILICFEIRFTQLWERIKGADIIVVPALWGVLRKTHFESITQALAIINQAFVIASDSTNEDMAASSGIITPFGVETRDDDAAYIEMNVDLGEIKKMRRYMNVGIQ